MAAPAFSARLPSTVTSPARIIACAFWRDSAKPRSTTSTSSRLRVDLPPMTRDLLGSPQYQEFRDRSQPRGFFSVGLQLGDGLRSQIVRNLVRTLQSENRRIGCLLLRCVFSGGLSQHGRGLLDVQNIVGHLERPSDRFAKAPQPGHFVDWRTRRQCARSNGSPNERCRLRLVNILQRLGANVLAFRLEV